jgi:hypothetical protein
MPLFDLFIDDKFPFCKDAKRQHKAGVLAG